MTYNLYKWLISFVLSGIATMHTVIIVLTVYYELWGVLIALSAIASVTWALALVLLYRTSAEWRFPGVWRFAWHPPVYDEKKDEYKLAEKLNPNYKFIVWEKENADIEKLRDRRR